MSRLKLEKDSQKLMRVLVCSIVGSYFIVGGLPRYGFSFLFAASKDP